MAEESGSSYGVLFQNLEDRGLSTPRLIISDAHAGLVSAIRESFPDASWQRCKVHFMRNILAYVPQKEKNPNRIREARRRSGVSTLKIASALGICRDTVYRWERGETLLSSSVLLNLGYIFGVTCDWLVCRSDDPYKTVDGVDIRSVESNLDIGI